MSNPFIGEIRLVAFNFAPQGWQLCNGDLLAIAQSEVLFDLIGTTFGGDGQTTFQLPNLQSRNIIGQGQGNASTYVVGQAGGAESVTLTTQQMPPHTHTLMAAPDGTTGTPATSTVLGTPLTVESVYAVPGAATALSPNAIAPSGGSQPHENRQPFLALNYIVSLFGIFPSQN